MAYTADHLEHSRAEGFGPLPVLRAALAAMLELKGGPVRLLDCGCGTGFFTRQYARLPGVTAVGLDMDGTLLSAARKLAEKEGLSTEFVQGDITKLPYPDDSFDAAASDILLEIFPDKTVPIGELVRVCRPGGRVLCMEPNYLSAVYYDPRLTAEDNRLWIQFQQAGRAFGAGVELPDAMRRSGLGDLQIVPWLWGGLKEDGEAPEEAYLQERNAELDRGVQLGLVPESDAEQYRALFRRSAAARRKGSAAVLRGINVYLVCGQKPDASK
ncbi:MAG: methyltransferase domain-containing protein [Oscillibacter sp.]|nr:methyltransferase domain-containing protein [Oscillibacter sp.]